MKTQGYRRELEENPLCLALDCWNLEYADPLVLLHLEVRTESMPNLNTESIANQKVQKPAVPIAFSKVRHMVHERDLDDFP